MRKPKQHDLKVLPYFFTHLVLGVKPFEIRKNDRDFKVGDILLLREWHNGRYSGSELAREVTFITDFEQKPGYVVMGLA
jgi:hypothetical protein